MQTLKKKYSNEQLKELKRQAQYELARTHFADYFSISNPTYYHMRHTLYISNYLDRIANGEQLNLIVEVPPRHGKSALITETFPSYYLMKNPSNKVISTAYSDSLARKFGRLNRNKFKELAEPLFDIDVSYDNNSSGNWSTADGGTMISTGIMGSLTGEGADLMIIDDPVKNKQEAYSKTYRDRVWDEWEATLSTRLHDGASVIVVQTRWHEDDLTGRLLESKGRDWIRIRLPAVAEEDDLLGRVIGQPLAPELGYDEDWATQKKKETGSATWNSLFQQRPSAEEGSIFVRKWWQYYDKIPHRFDEQLISWDLTFKGDEESDFVVGQVWGRKGADYYLVDQIRDRMDFPTTLKTIKNVANKYRRVRTILIEEKANGSAVISSLNREISGIIPINPKDSKIVRAQAITPLIEAGNVFIPSNAEFTSDFVEETANFPYGKNDDVVDAMTQALNRFMDKKAARIGNKNIW